MIAAAILAAAALTKLWNAAEKTEKLLEKNRQRANFSAAAASVQARRNAMEAYREKEIGDRVGASADYLMQSEQSRKDAKKDREVLSDKVENYLAGFSNSLHEMAEWPINQIAKGINKLVEDKDEKKTPTLFEIGELEAAAAAKRDELAAAKRREAAEQARMIRPGVGRN